MNAIDEVKAEASLRWIVTVYAPAFLNIAKLDELAEKLTP